MNRVAILLVILLFALIAPVYSADETIYPTTIGKLNAEVSLFGQGKITGLAPGEEAKLETITFQESEFQKVKMLKEELIINGTIIRPKYVLDQFGNKYAVFIINQNGDFNYELRADINTSAFIFDMADYPLTSGNNAMLEYTEQTEKIESSATEIMTLEKNKIYSKTFFSVLNETVDWVNDYVEYAKGNDFRYYYLEQKSAVQTLISRKGVCDEFTNLAASILRSKKIPTRVAIGITFDGKDWGNHAWMEVHDQNMSTRGIWIPSDATFREAGFVDATHIKMGSFDDVSNSKARCYYPISATCNLDNQSRLPQVTIKSKEYFSSVTMSAKSDNMKANKWNDVNVTVKNISNGTIAVPVTIKENYNELMIQEKKKSVVLKAGEEQVVTFKVFPKIDLRNDEYANGTLTFSSLSAPLEKDIVVYPGSYSETDGEVIVEDVTPIAHEGTLKFVIKISNFYQADQEAKISITANGVNELASEIIPAMGTKVITKEFDQYQIQVYTISIDVPGKIYTQKVIPIKTKIILPDDTEKPTVIEKIVTTSGDGNSGVIADEGSNPIPFFAMVIIVMLLAVAIVLAILSFTTRRYV